MKDKTKCICNHSYDEHDGLNGCRHLDRDGFSCSCEYIFDEGFDEVSEFKQEQFDFLKEKKMKELPKTIARYETNSGTLEYSPSDLPAVKLSQNLGFAEFLNSSKIYKSIGVYALVKEYHKESKKEFIHTSKDNRSYYYHQLATPHLKNILAQERLNPRKRAILEYELSRREMMGEK